MPIRVFIENEAGSEQRHLHDEKRLRHLETVRVSRPYPFPYGFVIDTTAEDGDNVDCFVLTREPLATGTILDCEPVGLLEQIEDGEIDHNVLAVPIAADPHGRVDPALVERIRDFVLHVFSHVPGKVIAVGELHGREAALAHVRAHADPMT